MLKQSQSVDQWMRLSTHGLLKWSVDAVAQIQPLALTLRVMHSRALPLALPWTHTHGALLLPIRQAEQHGATERDRAQHRRPIRRRMFVCGDPEHPSRAARGHDAHEASSGQGEGACARQGV